MLRSRKTYVKIFFVLLFVLFLFSELFFADPYFSFRFVIVLQEMFFEGALGQAIFLFFLPGIRIAQFIVDPIFEPLICPFFDGCPGRYDGALIDSYFFFPLQILTMSALYAGVVTGIVYGIDWVRSRRK